MVLAVVDTGVDFAHEDLRDNAWVNPDEIPGNNIDDDNNGYVDDVNGVNTVDDTGGGNPVQEEALGRSHGTHVAGLAAAVSNNDVGVAGVLVRMRRPLWASMSFK